eukprot:gene2281-biopygen12500
MAIRAWWEGGAAGSLVNRFSRGEARVRHVCQAGRQHLRGGEVEVDVGCRWTLARVWRGQLDHFCLGCGGVARAWHGHGWDPGTSWCTLFSHPWAGVVIRSERQSGSCVSTCAPATTPQRSSVCVPARLAFARVRVDAVAMRRAAKFNRQ